MNKMNTTYEIHISSEKIKNCDEIVNLLFKNKIIGSVSSNKSIIQKNNKYIIENGCKIIVSTNDTNGLKEYEKTLWEPLKKEFNLDCAYVKLNSYYNGCVYDFYRKTNCPHNK